MESIGIAGTDMDGAGWIHSTKIYIRAHKALKTIITMINYGIDKGQLETLLYDALPYFPMVSSIYLLENLIRRFQSIHQRSKNNTDTSTIIPSYETIAAQLEFHSFVVNF